MEFTFYQNTRPYFKTGDLLLWQGNSAIAKIIQLFGNTFNHASYVINSNICGVKRILLYEALASGVKPTFLSHRLKTYNGSCFWLQLKTKFDYLRCEIYRNANVYGGVGYDFKGLFKNAFGYVSVDAEKLFCSEYIYLAGIKAGLPKGSVTKAPKPDDLIKLGWWKKPVKIEV